MPASPPSDRGDREGKGAQDAAGKKSEAKRLGCYTQGSQLLGKNLLLNEHGTNLYDRNDGCDVAGC